MQRTAAVGCAAAITRKRCLNLPVPCRSSPPWKPVRDVLCSPPSPPACQRMSLHVAARVQPECLPVRSLPQRSERPLPVCRKDAEWEHLPVTIFKWIRKDCMCPVTPDAADIYLANTAAGAERQPPESVLGYDDLVATESVDVIQNLGCASSVDCRPAELLPSDGDCSGMVSAERVHVTIVRRLLHREGIPGTNYAFVSPVACDGLGAAALSLSAPSSQHADFSAAAKSSPSSSNDRSSLPTREMLHVIQEDMAKQVPRFFVAQHHYEHYHHTITLENNYSGKRKVSRGVVPYVLELTKVKMLFRVRYSYVRMHVLKITSHPEDGTVRIRWRISAVPHLAALKFWQLPTAYFKSAEDSSRWYDGFSILHVSKEGKIYRHCVERVMPDEEQDKVLSSPLAAVPT